MPAGIRSSLITRIALAVLLLTAVAIVSVDTNPAIAGGRHAGTFKVGTLGVGAEYVTDMNARTNLKFGVNGFNYSYDSSEGGVDYDFDLKLFSVAALVDYHPSAGSFRLTGGLLFNGNKIEATGKPTGAATYTIGATTYTSAQVGTLAGDIEFKSVAPYIGIGFGNALSADGNTSFVFDLGVVFQGSPDVTLSADGLLATNAAFMTDLKKEEQDLQSGIDSFEFYPVVSLGFSYRF